MGSVSSLISLSTKGLKIRSVNIIIVLVVLCSCNGQPKSLSEKEDASTTVPTDSIESTDGIVYFSDDNGITWRDKSKGLPDTATVGLGAIAVSSNSLAISVKESGIYLFDFKKGMWVNIPTDKDVVERNIGALTFYKDRIFVGTQFGGVFYSADYGKNWTKLNSGLANLTVRKIVQVEGKLYVGTNAGLYSYSEQDKRWKLEYGNSTLQVNGITGFDGSLYIGTNQGVFTNQEEGKGWKVILRDRSVHNISSDDSAIYAMVYNELLSSVDNGKSWQNIQKGLPKSLYTFNVIRNGSSILAAQWDGVYRKDDPNESWEPYRTGLPDNLAITNMTAYNGLLVVSGAERGLRSGMTTER